jgi:ABC-type transport system involved in multi-copper enzyme maturation permease subunit
MSVFSALVHNEIRRGWSRHDQSRLAKRIGLVLFVLFFAAGCGFYIWNVARGNIPFEIVVNSSLYLIGVAYAPLGLGMHSVMREWKSGTAAWWLSLPHSRWLLISAKLAGIVIRFLRILLALYVVNKVLTFIGLWLLHAPASSYLASLRTDVKVMVLILPLGLAFSAFGLLVAFVNQTPLKPFSFLFWLAFGFGLVPLTSGMVMGPA